MQSQPGTFLRTVCGLLMISGARRWLLTGRTRRVEFAALSHKLAVTGDRLKDLRAREHALDQSRRELVA
jgi:hypothetical protein